MKNELAIAHLAVGDMVRIGDNYAFVPTIADGSGFFRSHLIERIVRDIRAIQFHPLPEKHQQLFSGRITPGLEPLGT